MKIIKFITIIFIGLLFSQPVLAQRQLDDYRYQYDKYRKEYKTFDIAKNEYLQQNTLTSQKNATEKTQAILIQRGEVLRVYFLAIKYQLDKQKGIEGSEKTKLSSQLATEIAWLQNHIDDIKAISNPTLTDLFQISDRLETKQSDYATLAYKVRAQIIIGKTRIINQDYLAFLNSLKTKIAKNNSNFLNNWYDQAMDKSIQSEEAVKSAVSIYAKLGGDQTNLDRTFPELLDELTSAKSKLLEGLAYQKEIINQIEGN